MKKIFRVGLFVAAVILALVPSGPDLLSGEYGCWTCRAGANGMFGPSESHCDHVGDNEAGLGIYCVEKIIIGIAGCEISGGSCFYFTVNGGFPDDDPPIE